MLPDQVSNILSFLLPLFQEGRETGLKKYQSRLMGFEMPGNDDSWYAYPLYCILFAKKPI